MIYSFNEEIKNYLNNNCNIEVEDNIDKAVLEYVTNEVNPYYIPTDNKVTHTTNLLTKIEETQKFYGKTNIILNALRDTFNSHLNYEGWAHLHSSVVTINNQAVIFVADSQKGKSSSEFLLCKYDGYSFGAIFLKKVSKKV